MTIKFKKDLIQPGIDYSAGDTLEDAETVFGMAQAQYFIEQGYAVPVGARKETAVMPKGETATTDRP